MDGLQKEFSFDTTSGSLLADRKAADLSSCTRSLTLLDIC